MAMSTLCVITDQGKKSLGRLLRESRIELGLSLDELVEYIRDHTGQTLSKSSLSELERGNVDPKWNTLSTLAASGYLLNGDKPYTTTELFEIACEKDPHEFTKN